MYVLLLWSRWCVLLLCSPGVLLVFSWSALLWWSAVGCSPPVVSWCVLLLFSFGCCLVCSLLRWSPGLFSSCILLACSSAAFSSCFPGMLPCNGFLVCSPPVVSWCVRCRVLVIFSCRFLVCPPAVLSVCANGSPQSRQIYFSLVISVANRSNCRHPLREARCVFSACCRKRFK